MESLPDDIWHKILQIGIKVNRLDHTDLCSLAIVNNRFDQLTQDPALWATLLSRDFPFSFHYVFQAPSKDHYRKEYERSKIRRFYDPSFFTFDLFEIPSPTFPELDWLIWEPNIGDDLLSRYQSRIQDLRLQRTSNSRSSRSYFSHSATQVSSGNQSNIANITVGGFGDVSSLFEEGDPTNQSILTQAKRQYYEKKPKRFDKSSKPKVIPNTKSYIPMNRPPRRCMPRKI